MDNTKDPQTESNHDIKRKAWLAVFLSCSLFWIVAGLILYRYL